MNVKGDVREVGPEGMLGVVSDAWIAAGTDVAVSGPGGNAKGVAVLDSERRPDGLWVTTVAV